jgi:hypothetical protein
VKGARWILFEINFAGNLSDLIQAVPGVEDVLVFELPARLVDGLVLGSKRMKPY